MCIKVKTKTKEKLRKKAVGQTCFETLRTENNKLIKGVNFKLILRSGSKVSLRLKNLSKQFWN